MSDDTLIAQALAILAKRMRVTDQFLTPSSVRDYLRLLLSGREYEVFVVILLDAQHRVLSCEELFRGTLTQASVYPREVVKAALAANEPLWKGYVIKEMMGLIWEQTSRRKMEAYLKEWCLLAAGSGVRQLQSMAKSVAIHASGILAWWEHPISNGRMEGINNKVKAMLRQHYGLRDVRFFILRLLGLHEAKFKLSGC